MGGQSPPRLSSPLPGQIGGAFSDGSAATVPGSRSAGTYFGHPSQLQGLTKLFQTHSAAQGPRLPQVRQRPMAPGSPGSAAAAQGPGSPRSTAAHGPPVLAGAHNAPGAAHYIKPRPRTCRTHAPALQNFSRFFPRRGNFVRKSLVLVFSRRGVLCF